MIVAPQPLLSLHPEPRSACLSASLCFHKLANCPSPVIDLEILYFHALANRSFDKAFVFSSIQIAGGVTPLPKKRLCALDVSMACLRQANAFFSVAWRLLDSLAFFFAYPSFVFNGLQPLLPKYRGWGGPPSWIARIFRSMYPDQLWPNDRNQLC